jgi:hypothetical protein
MYIVLLLGYCWTIQKDLAYAFLQKSVALVAHLCQGLLAPR